MTTWLWLVLVLSWLVSLVVLVLLVQLLRRGLSAPAATEQAVGAAAATEGEAERQAQHQQVLERVQQELAEARTRIEELHDQLGDAHRQRDGLEEKARTEQERQYATRLELEQAQADLRRQAEEAEGTRRAAEDQLRQERSDLRQLRSTLEMREQRLGEREERLLSESQSLEARSAQLVEVRAQAEQSQQQAREELAQARAEAAQALEQANAERERIAELDQEQARAEVLARVEHEARLEATALARDIERTARREAETRARGIIVTAIQRLAAEQSSESVVSTLDLPSDEMKGRIIGREGRNIRHFEQVTGVNVMIDDTPGSVLLSCFDPVRREIGRLTLAELVADGRIHPARIEEVHERATARIQDKILRSAEDALAEVGISDLDPALVPVVGALRYRTSYGQNVLRHLVECAHIAGMMAAELGLDVPTCKRAAFLHDIGKALTHEVEGTHAMVGAELARRHGESEDIVHAIAAHHNEVEPSTVEAVLTQAADAISGSRPGARRESLEAYVQRLDRLEEIAASHDGVEKVFAMQAGREVRVMVSPDHVDDTASHALARDIAHEIQDELTYPGQIRVTVVRESRATEIAH